MKCPRCQQESPSDADFCPECGAKPAVVCVACGTANAPAHKYCKKCGQAFDSGVGAAQAGNPAKSVSSYTPKHLAEKILTSKGRRDELLVLDVHAPGAVGTSGVVLED